MRKKARAAANNGHKLRLCRDLLHPRGVQSKAGGVLANGPFYVKVEVFGSDLIYREGQRTLTLPVDFDFGGSCVVQTGAIRRWDGSFEIFDKAQIAIIERNIFAALDHLRIG